VFPKVPDQHKIGKPLISNGLGVAYVLFTTVYLFLFYFFGVGNAKNDISAPLTLAVCILFGGFMGLLDDWMDLKWRYKAFMPLIAALPLIYLARGLELRTSISIPLIGALQLSSAYYYLVIPLIVMIVTNAVNMLGGLNGLESLCPAITLVGLVISGSTYLTLMLGPLLFWFALSILNFKGKLFVGNSGSFAIGITIASFAVMADLKLGLLISVIPYVFNSALILLTIFFVKKKANVIFDGKRLISEHRRSLITLITYRRPLSERQVVLIISIITAIFSLLAVLAVFEL